MTPHHRKQLSIVLGIVVSIGLMAMLFYKIDIGGVWNSLRGANYWWLLPNIFLVMFSMYQRAYRWKFMVAPIKPVKYKNLLAATCIGFMANNVLPLRLGEFVRAYSLSYQDKGITKSASLATIFVERMVFDLVVLLMIFFAVVSTSHLSLSDDMRQGAIVTIVIALFGVIFMLWLALRPNEASRVISNVFFFLPVRFREKIMTTMLKFTRGLEFIRNAKTLGWVFFQTMIIWLVLGISNYFVMLAFGFQLPLAASFVLLVVVSISILIPSSPGFVGVYHIGTVWTLSTYNIPREDALSFALVLHAAQYIPVTLMGFYYLRKEHLSLKELEEAAVETTDEAEDIPPSKTKA